MKILVHWYVKMHVDKMHVKLKYQLSSGMRGRL